MRDRSGFLSPAWAWPRGSLDRLLRAACLPDEATALADFSVWLGQNAIDDVPFRDHRLLAAVAQRFGKRLADRPEYPRLIGLQRHLWTRSRLAMADCAALLATMTAEGITPILLKGAARIAARPDDQKGRVAHDVDLLLPPQQFRSGLSVLLDNGWQASTGASRLRLLAEADRLRAMNFFGGRFGDIDLHQWAYGDAPVRNGLEEDLLDSLEAAQWMGVAVRIPSPTDRLALAICHSGRDAHAHSDWMVDCAQLIAEGRVDWPRLVETLVAAEAVVPARVALGYLQQRLEAPVPESARIALEQAPAGGVLARVGGLLEAKPRADWSAGTRLLRGVVKQLRLASRRRMRPPESGATRGRCVGRASGKVEGSPGLDACLGAPPEGSSRLLRFELVVSLVLPKRPRRVELELNAESAHLIRLRYRSLSKRGGRVLLRFAGEVELPADADGLWVSSRPSRQLRPGAGADEKARYDPLPILVEHWRIGSCKS